MLLRRRLLGAFSLFSLILCGTTVVLWVRSYWVRTEAEWWRVPRASEKLLNGDEPDRMLKFRPTRGSFQVKWVREEPQWWFADEHGHWQERPQPQVAKKWKFGDRGEVSAEFDEGTIRPLYGRWVDGTGEDVRSVTIPLWLPFLAMLLVPVACTTLGLGRTRRRLGLCPACGYDLRATPGRCSECGWREVGGDTK